MLRVQERDPDTGRHGERKFQVVATLLNNGARADQTQQVKRAIIAESALVQPMPALKDK